MLKRYCCALLFILPSFLFAQDYRYIDSTCTWTVLSISFGNIYSTSYLRIKGDTIFGARIYKKLYSSSDSSFANKFYEGGLRQDTLNKKVFFRSFDIGCGPEETLVDFSLNKGDSSQTYVCSPMKYAVDSVDSVNIDGELKMRQFFSYNGGMTEYCIEGIGSSFSLIRPHWNFCVFDLEYHVTCVQRKGSVIWTNPAFTSCEVNGIRAQEMHDLRQMITPNPVSGTSIVDLHGGVYRQFDVYDLSGKCVRAIDCQGSPVLYLHAADFAKGMYFYHACGDDTSMTGKFIVQ